MALTKVSGGILQQPIDVGIITATSIQVGSGTTIHDAGIDLGSGNLTSHNINSTGIVTSTGLDINGDGDISGDLSVSGNVSIGGTLTYEDVTNIDSVGLITARDGIIVTGGNVGIGTDNPTRLLTLHSPTQPQAVFSIAGVEKFRLQSFGSLNYIDSIDQELVFRTGSVGQNESIRIDSGGKIVSTYDGTPSAVAQYGQLEVTKNGVSGVDPNWSYLSFHRAGQVAWQQGLKDNDFVIAYTSGAARDTLDNERLRITTSGNVGIGLTNPSAKLHISSGGATQMLISNTSASMSDGDTIGTIDFTAGPSFTTNARVAGLVEGTSEAGGDLIFETRQDGGSLTEKVRITSGGLVGIGTDNPGSRNLQVYDSTGTAFISLKTGTGTLTEYLFGNQADDNVGRIRYDHSDNSMALWTNATEKLRITSTGLVGIGTDNPSARLHVHGGTNDTPAYFDTGNANGAHIRFLQGGSVRHFLGCGGGISLGDKDDLTMRAYDNIIFATANSSNRKATLLNGGEFIVGATSSAAGLVHVQHDEITAAAPSLGWPHYLAENDDNARIALHLETAGNTSNSSTAGHGASVVLRMGQYYDSRAVITTLAAGGASPSDQGTGHGKDLLIKGGRSDNNNGKYGGRLFLNGGSGFNGGNYDAYYGNCIIQGLGGLTGIGELSPNYPLDISHTNNSAYSASAFIAPSVEIHNQSTTDGTAAGIHMYVTGSGANAAAAHINCVHTGNGSGALCFGTRHNAGNHSEKLRITSNGDFWVSGNSMNHLKNEYRGSVSVTGTNNESFAFEIQGASYGSGGLLYVYATSGNVVVNFSAEILVNHSNDVTIKSMSGAYTQARIRVKTDSNARAAIYLGRNAGYAPGTTSLNWKFIPYGGTYAYTTESTNNGTDHTHVTTSGSFNLTAAGGGSANVNAAGTKNFLINHPLESLRETTRLAHAAIEGPECNTIYRGKVDLVGGTATVNIDTNSRMTEGTFEALNQNVQCFTTNETGWTPIKGSISGNLLTITAQDNTCIDTISWMVVGERKDQDIIDNRATDSEGRFIPEITDEYDASQFAEYVEPVEETEESS